MKKQHYYLVSGEILYRLPGEDGVGTRRLNSILQLDENLIRHREIGRAQQMLQLHFFNQMGDAELQIADLFLYPFTYLGHMTEEDFRVRPEGEQAVVDLTPFDGTKLN